MSDQDVFALPKRVENPTAVRALTRVFLLTSSEGLIELLRAMDELPSVQHEDDPTIRSVLRNELNLRSWNKHPPISGGDRITGNDPNTVIVDEH